MMLCFSNNLLQSFIKFNLYLKIINKLTLMNALRILLLSILILYLTIHHTTYWKYFFSLLIPYYIITQLLLSGSNYNTPKKKFLISMWNSPSDPQIYGVIPFNITSLEKFLKDYSNKYRKNIGITVFFIKMMGLILEKYPQINGNVIFGKFVPKATCDISLMIAAHEGIETELITIKNANKLSLSEISQKISEKKEGIEKHTDKAHNRRLIFAKLLPTLYFITKF